MGKKKNSAQYNKLYADLYSDARKELRDLKEQYQQLENRYNESMIKISDLEKQIKVQQEIIEELEGGDS